MDREQRHTGTGYFSQFKSCFGALRQKLEHLEKASVIIKTYPRDRDHENSTTFFLPTLPYPPLTVQGSVWPVAAGPKCTWGPIYVGHGA